MSTSERVTVRIACLSDADDIALLTAELGYDVDPSRLRQTLSRILAEPSQSLLLAEADGLTVGWLHAGISEFIETGRFLMIAGLVVRRSHRRQGIGRRLMEHAETWAREQGCSVVRLWSTSARKGAHQFYQQLGYRNIKTQYSFAKSLNADTGDDLRRFVPRIE